MKSRIKVSLLLLSLILCLPLIASCAGNTEPETTTGAEAAATTLPEESTEAPLMELEVKILGGEFNVLWPSVHSDGHFVHNEIWSENPNGDVINDAVYNRNAIVEEKYGITIQTTLVFCSSIASTARKTWASGDKAEYDAFCTQTSMLTSSALEGVIADYKNMTYYSEEMPWWDSRVMKEFEMGGHRFFGSGDIIYSDNFYPYTIFANLDFYSNYNFDTSLYSLVKNGTWTVDKMMEIMKDIPSSADEKWNYEDTYGILVNKNLARAIYFGSGNVFSKTAEDGTVSIEMTVENTQDILEKCITLFHGGLAYDTDDDIGHNIPGLTHAQTALKMFAAGQSLFYSEELIIAERPASAGFDHAFAVLPVPKFYADQEDYICVMNDATLVCVPANADTDRSSLILSAMGRASIDTLTPAFYNIVLTYKYMNDPESVEMLNIILRTAKPQDIGSVLDWGKMMTEFRNCVRDNRTDFASKFASASKIAKASLKSYNAALDKLG